MKKKDFTIAVEPVEIRVSIRASFTPPRKIDSGIGNSLLHVSSIRINLVHSGIEPTDFAVLIFGFNSEEVFPKKRKRKVSVLNCFSNDHLLLAIQVLKSMSGDRYAYIGLNCIRKRLIEMTVSLLSMRTPENSESVDSMREKLVGFIELIDKTWE